ncbi:hypothetical protein NFI96_010324 [Prochilodus magdalenae]|nr:hypothetical protein NFI96_010324 [Prochilodus magdalenae]
MELAEKLVVLYSLFGVSLCSDSFSVTLPQSVEAVNGLCVLINCSFTIDENTYKGDLQNNPKGIWFNGGNQKVFDSTTPESNKIKGRITGELRMKDCTTIFNRINNDENGTYYFRIEAGRLKYTYKPPSVSINVRDSPPKPTLSLYRDQTELEDRRILEGSSVSLFCSALSSCPTQPLTLTWRPLPINTSQQQIQNTSFISSQLNFIATRLHHGLRFNCTATYQLEDKDTKTAQRSLILHVLYSPRNTSISVSPYPVMLGSSVSLSCSSDGNPPVNYTWYRQNGEQIETGPSLTINQTNNTHSGLYCRAQNQHGAQNSSVQLDIQYTPRNTSISASPSGPVVLGSSVSLRCSSDGNPAVNYTWYKENGQQIETGPSLTINQTNNTHSGLYYCRAQNQHGAQNSSVQLDIQYAPQISSSSYCNSSSENVIQCVCEVHGHPVPKVEWRLSGQPVSPSSNPPIREEPIGNTSLRSEISLHRSLTGMPSLMCISTNKLGSTSQLFSMVAGHCSSAVTAFTTGQFPTAEQILAEYFDTYKTICQEQEEEEGESLYANKNMISPEHGNALNNPDNLHYSTINFLNDEERSSEVRGLSSLTPNYATIQHSSRQNPERETIETGNSTATEKPTKLDMAGAKEIVQPTKEEATYGNIIHNKTSQSNLADAVNMEQSETKPTDQEDLAEAKKAESIYAQVNFNRK